ncbi:MAG TPA: response regulator [Ferruginibacter sp.]|nr:response regulator [Ferruginibacter sp.]HPH90530.1 response regulator [Ferruginibacter sp.]
MKRILVVDDDTDILNLVKTILALNSYAVETIADWKQLNNAIESFRPHLILLDISLSGASGLDLCDELKKAENTMHIPVVLFSANVEMAKRVSECGAVDYIAKPFSIKDLLVIIEKNS